MRHDQMIEADFGTLEAATKAMDGLRAAGWLFDDKQPERRLDSEGWEFFHITGRMDPLRRK